MLVIDHLFLMHKIQERQDTLHRKLNTDIDIQDDGYRVVCHFSVVAGLRNGYNVQNVLLILFWYKMKVPLKIFFSMFG